MLINQIGRAQIIGTAFLALAMVMVVGTALGFEHIGGFIPCKLCLEQREPYYLGIVVALLGFAGAYLRWPGCVARGALMVVGLLMAYGLVLSVYHSGVEWAFWAGPADCATSSTTGQNVQAIDMLGALDAFTPPSCDQAAGRFLGLSFAGWNVIASAMLAFTAFKAAFAEDR